MDKSRLLDEVSERVGVSGDRKQHIKLMIDVLDSLRGTGLIFKGGSSILLCHGGSRFSEDLDFDVDGRRNLTARLQAVSKAYTSTGWSWNVRNPKNTETTNRYVIYAEKGETLLKLKLDISMRHLDQSKKPVIINGIETYSSSDIFKQKVNAIVGNEDGPGRTKVRDIYDINFLMKKPECHATFEDLSRLKEGLVSPDGVFERYIEDWEDDEITSEFQLDELSVDIFKSIEFRLGAALTAETPSGLSIRNSLDMVSSSDLKSAPINIELLSKTSKNDLPEPER